MIYRVYNNNEEKLTIDADVMEEDGSGVRFIKDGLVVAFFYSGQARQVFPIDTLEVSTVTE